MVYNFAKNFGIKNAPTWCPGCGNFAIQAATKNALVSEGFNPHNTVFVFDVGCSGNGADKIEANTVHGLHGRAISLAAGVAIANPKMKIIASSGDGATFSEGPGHLIHAIRNNYPMVFMLHNNENYGLTTGQASALTPKGAKMNASPDGVYLEPINALQFVLSLNPSFVARTFSSDIPHMTVIFKEAIKHDGFAFVEILQTCPTYNKATPDAWYKERVKKIEDLKDYDPSDIWAARKLAEDMEKDVYLGIFYKDTSRESFLKMIPNRKNTTTSLIEEVKNYDVKQFL
ncbi:2-oxoacid ferredoxin oxidoreductase [Candidatus Peregrinibacteria bacterium CG_4_10_14_0_2_um_filter_38_24]|nr:MAG: 2-oxoacid ferredoxin oxidoreductase [Candidatus Peregrinibacteria bacterium CG_4_10_14_0_2_um_filter_38_24]PJC38783.1 MAG: 2-oxoacid ferredoxin oxidoreductase [Candidatus Peregrinibacteria bacterium CG_4_9_14_0_2_um_filter_38_9]